MKKDVVRKEELFCNRFTKGEKVNCMVGKTKFVLLFGSLMILWMFCMPCAIAAADSVSDELKATRV